jgi:cyclopropane fatty-acyl-phospholipid synthase-like methyltransferase
VTDPTTRPDDDGLAEAAHAAMRWNTPLSPPHAAVLLERLELSGGRSVLDLGCGWGELLLRAVAASPDPDVHGVGVDTHLPDLERGRAAAADRGLEDRVTFLQGSAVAWSQPADRVLCVGASHAWGGSAGAIAALPDMVAPGGLLLLGDGFWAKEPSRAALEIFGDGVMPLPDLIRRIHAAGWQVRHLSQADQSEWDEFETTWRLGPHRWLADHRNAPAARGLREQLRDRLQEYLEVYRGVLGFCYLVLAR